MKMIRNLLLSGWLFLICLPVVALADGAGALTPPFEGRPRYPFERDTSIGCGHWPRGSDDYPFFGAPRNGGRRRHAGVDLYPPGGAGTDVRAIKDGVVRRIARFYIRRNGEVTYAVLVDHGDFVANYAELRKPLLKPSQRLAAGDVIGQVSGTKQLHFELYAAGALKWTSGWYGKRPEGLQDPTAMMIGLFGQKSP